MTRVVKNSILFLAKCARALIKLPRFVIAVARLWISRIIYRRKRPAAIGLVVDSFGNGGMERVVLNLYHGYRSRGIPAYIISVSNQVSNLINTIEDDPRHMRILHWSTVNLIDYCRRNNITTLQYHFSIFRIPTMRMLGFNVIYTIHNAYVWFNKNAWRRTKMAALFSNHVVAVSDFARNYFINKTGIQGVHTVYNGIDVEGLLRSRDNNKKYQRKNYNLKKDDIVFVNVASFNEQKYQLSLVGAMEEVVRRQANVKLLLVGPVGDKKLYEHVKKVIDMSPAKNNIIITGPVQQNEIGDFLSSIPDAFILPSIYEAGVPLVVIEALSCGLPTIMTDLDVSASPLGKNIITIAPPYNSLQDLTIQDVARMVRNKKSINHDDIVEKMLFVASNPSKYKPSLKGSDLNLFTIDSMTIGYLDLIGEKYEQPQ